MLVAIIISTVQLSLDNPLNDPHSKLDKVLLSIEIIASFIFVFEALLKIIANGFIFNGSLSYIRNSWNALDFLIILITVRIIFLTYIIVGSIYHWRKKPYSY
jgi:hypothetical protein